VTRFAPYLTAVALAATALVSPAAFAAGTLTVAQPQDPGSWDPIDTFVVNWSTVAENVFDGLIRRTTDMKLVPGLATSWEVRENNTKIRFKLREGVTFHNGEKFDASVVKYSFERLLGPEGAKGAQQSNYNAISGVEIIDDYTVDLVLKRADPVLLTKLAGYGAMMVPPKYIAEKGEDFFNANPVGTGPFKMTAYEPKVSVTLEKFDNFWGDKVKLDKVIYRFIAEPATASAELQAGRVDIVDNLPVSLVGTIAKNDKLKIESVTGPTVNAARFNTQQGIAKDVNVRKALIMAVDRDTIVKQILQGHAKSIVSFQADISFGYDPALKAVPFDPKTAKELLTKAGVKPGSEIQFDIRGSDATFREVAQAVAGYLQAVGIKVTLKPYETNVLINEIIPKGKAGEIYQNAWGGWTFDYDNTAYLMYHTGEHWNANYSNPKIDALLEAQRATYDTAVREKTLREVAAVVAEEALEIPLYNLNTIYGVSKRVKGFVPPSDRRFRLNEVTVD